MISWTDERVEVLKKLWSEGLSASQIAAELTGVTRNAVIRDTLPSGTASAAGTGERITSRMATARAHAPGVGSTESARKVRTSENTPSETLPALRSMVRARWASFWRLVVSQVGVAVLVISRFALVRQVQPTSLVTIN